jgi:hypothetical protein
MSTTLRTKTGITARCAAQITQQAYRRRISSFVMVVLWLETSRFIAYETSMESYNICLYFILYSAQFPFLGTLAALYLRIQR